MEEVFVVFLLKWNSFLLTRFRFAMITAPLFSCRDEYVLQLQQHAFDMINFSHRPMDQALSPREPREMSRGSMEGSGQGLVELLSAYNTQ